MTTDPPCPLCAARTSEPLKRFEDGVVVGRCAGCGLMYCVVRHPTPHAVLAPTEIDRLRATYGPVLLGEARHYRWRTYLSYVRTLERYAPGRRLLDVGCAHGFFGRQARGAGFTVTAVEPNAAMATFARDENGLDVLEGRLEDVDLGTRRFDAVTFTDSLEYMPDPVAALRRVVAHLEPGGVVFVRVPNGRASLLRLALERSGLHVGAGAFTPTMRVVHFTPETLARAARAAGLTPVEAGRPAPIRSPSRRDARAGRAELAPPFWDGLAGHGARLALQVLGRLEGWAVGRDHFAQSISLVARLEDGA